MSGKGKKGGAQPKKETEGAEKQEAKAPAEKSAEKATGGKKGAGKK